MKSGQNQGSGGGSAGGQKPKKQVEFMPLGDKDQKEADRKLLEKLRKAGNKIISQNQGNSKKLGKMRRPRVHTKLKSSFLCNEAKVQST